jgi:hypothetical protein
VAEHLPEEEERHGRSRGGASAGQPGLGLARQIDKRTSVPDSAMAVAASAYPAAAPDDAAATIPAFAPTRGRRDRAGEEKREVVEGAVHWATGTHAAIL